MSLDQVGIMENLVRQVAVIDVHILQSVVVLFTEKLIEKCLLQIDTFQVEKDNHAVVVAPITHVVVHVSAFVVDVDLLVDNICWRSHFGEEIEGNVLEAQEAK
jgi:hypothetical protein